MTNSVRRARGGRPVAVVKCGSAAVPIYRGVVRGRIRFTVAHYLNGQRRRQTFGSLDAAKEEARIAALNIQRGRSGDNDLRSQDREAFHAANHMLLGFGVPLLAAVEEYVLCRRKLGDRSLTTAIDEFQRRMCGFKAGVLVPNVVAEMILAKKQDDLSERTVATLRSVLGRFKLKFPGKIADVTSSEIHAWLRATGKSTTTRNNLLRSVKVLFSFAKQCGYLPQQESSAAETLKMPKACETDVGLFKPDEMERLLRAAPLKLLPLLAIGAFAGLRAAEIARLNWSSVDLNRRIIELRAGQTKTAARRLIPISDNLAAWLATVPREGLVVPHRLRFTEATRLAKSLGIAWPHNALRHSYISYRIAVVQNAAQVALEAGNSPSIIFRHYRELVTKEEADKWFAIVPTA